MKKILFFLLLALNMAIAENHLPKALVTSLALIYPPQDEYKNLKCLIIAEPFISPDIKIKYRLENNPEIRQKAIFFYQNPTNKNCEDLLNKIMENFGMESKRNLLNKFISWFYKDEYSKALEKIKDILVEKDSYLDQKNIDFITDFLKKWYKDNEKISEYKKTNSNVFSNKELASKIIQLNKNKDAFKNDQLIDKILKKTKDALSPSSLDDVKSAQKAVKKGLQTAYKIFMKFKRYAR